MRLAFVVPRYGEEVVGGAEHGARMLAERLVATLGWEVEVFTTTAVDARTWDHHYPEADVDLNGVTVHRIRARAGRHPDFFWLTPVVELHPPSARRDDVERWIDAQGPYCPDLLDAVEASPADLVAFYPYLYYPTVRGIARVRDRAVLHPAAHDEPAIRLPVFREVFGAARGFAYHVDSERRLVERLFPVAHRPQVVTGLGAEPGAGDPEAARAALGLGDRPYVCAVGRVERAKGTEALVAAFAAYKRRRPGPLALALLGPVIDPVGAHPDVVVAGRVDEAVKWGALRGAAAFVHPSAYESFSIALMEAWLAGRAALVNGRSDVMRGHCERAGGGLWFDGYATFEAALDRLLADDGLRARLGRRGQAYVEAWYRWPAILDRYERFAATVLDKPTPATPES